MKCLLRMLICSIRTCLWLLCLNVLQNTIAAFLLPRLQPVSYRHGHILESLQLLGYLKLPICSLQIILLLITQRLDTKDDMITGEKGQWQCRNIFMSSMCTMKVDPSRQHH